jgi:uncharacterized protein with von Willebrand factor type A (vWA) domain
VQEPDAEAPHENLLQNVLLFARTLRASGLAVAANATMDAVRALEVVGIERRDDVRDALRAVLISRPEDLAAFDRVFMQFWRAWPTRTGARLPRPLAVPRRATTRVQWTAPGGAPSDVGGYVPPHDDESARVVTYSSTEVWRTKDFATYDGADLAQARALIDKLTWTPGLRLTRRWTPGVGQVVDLRRILRANLRHGGEPLIIPHRMRRLVPRPLVLLCDVSGSMEPYIRVLLLFIHALAHRRRSIELFLFSTRLTRVTRHFVRNPLDQALMHVRDVARDWSGGTRIGEALRTFNVDWARRVLRCGPAVLLISDGWDLGDPGLLKTEIARLRRASFRLIWLNPLVGSPGYEPLTRGMSAALPFVDDFLSVRNMASLESLATHLEALPPRRRRRSQRRGC